MLKVLIPVDGSENSQQAVRNIVARYMDKHVLEVHFLHVRPRYSRRTEPFVKKRDIAAYYRQESML